MRCGNLWCLAFLSFLVLLWCSVFSGAMESSPQSEVPLFSPSATYAVTGAELGAIYQRINELELSLKTRERMLESLSAKLNMIGKEYETQREFWKRSLDEGLLRERTLQTESNIFRYTVYGLIFACLFEAGVIVVGR